ncbi:hypothetical protein GCM10022243_48050 [Saccharothrix violaceirubra]|uniref:Uncharacterized protein n=1 Tax=Saccharothrix violaceirubra TaxID=413306 RepID=A0A7W7SZJ0_9PSEU|nr:hypothetical protein [Saccharothrix violaceirubra]MBB4963853.1 hypothetical protein [Saccharothrix violaceirubra]
MIVIPSGRHPHEILLMAVFVLAGVAGLIAPRRFSGQTLQALPHSTLLLFYGVLAAGGLLALVGVFLPGLRGPTVEMYGLTLLAVVLIGYGAAVWWAFGARGFFFALITIGIGAANVWRAAQINASIAAARRTLRALGDAP